MRNFAWSDYWKHYAYSPITQGEGPQIDVGYQLGGHNWFHGGMDQRGVFVTLRTIERGPDFTGFRIGGDNGFKRCAVVLQRKSVKQIERVAEALDEHAPSLCQVFAHLGPRVADRYLVWALKRANLMLHAPEVVAPSHAEIEAIVAADVRRQLNPAA